MAGHVESMLCPLPSMSPGALATAWLSVSDQLETRRAGWAREERVSHGITEATWGGEGR